jgi:hypothetical protein
MSPVSSTLEISTAAKIAGLTGKRVRCEVDHRTCQKTGRCRPPAPNADRFTKKEPAILEYDSTFGRRTPLLQRRIHGIIAIRPRPPSSTKPEGPLVAVQHHRND